MTKSKLALLGGTPVRTKLFPAYNTIGEEEKRAVQKVLDSGNLSQFLGAWHDDFYGGPKVREFEEAWSNYFEVKHSISVNSNTSGLIAAMGAAGVGPGDEVIVSPYTMSASAIAPLFWGAVPVFADIEQDYFCLSAESVKRKITNRTKAILIVHIFGQSSEMDAIMKIANERNIKVIEDCAQAPGAKYQGKRVGSLGHIGVFSLNYHKHIHTGEGGVCVTNDSDLAERLQLIRNHGENVVAPKGVKNIQNIYGYNFRMPEIEAAIGIEQLKKLDGLMSQRIALAEEVSEHIASFPGLIPPMVRPGASHVYYVHAIRFLEEKIGIKRSTFVKALKAELPSAVLRETTPIISEGYVKPLYLQPIYQTRAATCSFNCSRYEGEVDYSRGICPIAERMHFHELFTHELMRPGLSRTDMKDIKDGFSKVLECIPELKEWEKAQQS